ncbi:MAG: ferrous iron transport protein A [Candidatus Omnitrophica bacterium]|nr:ferrous iron transport protein A [Candidatus Omnitrophota bacterium]MCM8806629.1 ferrous iron transport protein A [Candidatus Omnitrophota bacterium]
MKRLSEVEEGKYKIVEILKPGKTKKMFNLGILIGDEIEVKKSCPGPVIIKKGNTSVAIGYGIAKDIIVEKVE